MATIESVHLLVVMSSWRLRRKTEDPMLENRCKITMLRRWVASHCHFYFLLIEVSWVTSFSVVCAAPIEWLVYNQEHGNQTLFSRFCFQSRERGSSYWSISCLWVEYTDLRSGCNVLVSLDLQLIFGTLVIANSQYWFTGCPTVDRLPELWSWKFKWGAPLQYTCCFIVAVLYTL